MKFFALLVLCFILTGCAPFSSQTQVPTPFTPSPSASATPVGVEYAVIQPTDAEDLAENLRARYAAEIQKHTLYPDSLASYSPLIGSGVVFIDREEEMGDSIQFEIFSDGDALMAPKYIPDSSYPHLGSVIALRESMDAPHSIAWVEHNERAWRLMTIDDSNEATEIDRGEIVKGYIPILEMHYVKGLSDGFGYYTCEAEGEARRWEANLWFYPYQEKVSLDVDLAGIPETGIPFTGFGFISLVGTRGNGTIAQVYSAQLAGVDGVMAPAVEEITEISIPDQAAVVRSLYQGATSLSYFVWQDAEGILRAFTPGTGGYHAFAPPVKDIVPANESVLAVGKDGRALFQVDFLGQLQMIKIYACEDGEEILGAMFSQPSGSIYMLVQTPEGLQVYEQYLSAHVPQGGE